MNDMKIFAFASVFVYLVFVAMAQEKHYKNQINRNLKESVKIKKRVEVKEQTSQLQTPKYQVNKPNIEWVDTFNTKTPSYKQHGGRPN